MPDGTGTVILGRGRSSSLSSSCDSWSSGCSSDTEEKWGTIDGKFRFIVDHAVRGREDGAGNDSGRCKSGGLAIFNTGSFCQTPLISSCLSCYDNGTTKYQPYDA